jgi:hypothetical protein
MNARLINRVETGIELVAAALFGGAVAYASHTGLAETISDLQLGPCSGGAGILAFLACGRAMRMAADRRPKLKISIFDVREIDFVEPPELVLTDADRLGPDELVLTRTDRLDEQIQEGPLVLDDILAEIGPDARVVRLFDRKAMPTPGQLSSRIDRHLGQTTPPSSQPDAAKALSDALAELKRSLR